MVLQTHPAKITASAALTHSLARSLAHSSPLPLPLSPSPSFPPFFWRRRPSPRPRPPSRFLSFSLSLSCYPFLSFSLFLLLSLFLSLSLSVSLSLCLSLSVASMKTIQLLPKDAICCSSKLHSLEVSWKLKGKQKGGQLYLLSTAPATLRMLEA